MKNNTIGKVELSTALDGRKKSHFNLSHDVSTTCGFGEVQPILYRHLRPNESFNVDFSSLIRLAPMVAPTWSRLYFKHWTQFVPMSDIFPNYASLLSQQAISRGTNSVVTQKLPSISIAALSSLILTGAFVTIYESNWMTDETTGEKQLVANLYKSPSYDANDLSKFPQVGTAEYKFMNAVKNQSGSVGTSRQQSYGFSSSAKVFGMLRGLFVAGKSAENHSDDRTGNDMMPLANPALGSFFAFPQSAVFPYEPVTLEGADLIITKPFYRVDTTSAQPIFEDTYITFAVRLSDFGLRLRKILLGLGYAINFDSKQQVSILPLLAYYKAYFDVFGLTLYQHWETTNCYKFISWLTNFNLYAKKYSGSPSLCENYLEGLLFSLRFVVSECSSPSFGSSSPDFLFHSFITDLANCFATAEQDIVSSHIAKTAISPELDMAKEFIDVSTGVIDDYDVQNSSGGTNGHAYIKNVIHGELDSEYLKRLYKWTNRNTIAGQRIAELLRAQGFGQYVDDEKSNFIGYGEEEVDVVDVVSTSDTFNQANSQGAQLGQYGGRGIKAFSSKKNNFETSEDGFVITLCSFVPNSGYCQALDLDHICLDKNDMYQAEFDGLGYEANPVSMVVADRNVTILSSIGTPDQTVDKVFGFAPRYTRFKMANNVLNGEYSLRSTRDRYLPYTLDKFIDLGEPEIIEEQMDSQISAGMAILTPRFEVSQLPTASPAWRYVSRYPWLSNFNRIFTATGEEMSQYMFTQYSGMQNDVSAAFDIFSRQPDNFMVQMYVNFHLFSPMLPISKSYETLDENGNGNMEITKA